MRNSSTALPVNSGIPKFLRRRLKRTLKRMTHAVRRNINRLRSKQVIYFLHIGKTGGSAIKYALRHHLNTKQYINELLPHRFKLKDIPNGEKVVFIVRDPISRFISGFYSRKRQGRPHYNIPWSPGEEAAFKQFGTANELAKALYSEDREIRNAALNAIRNIQHINASYWDWFGNEAYFQSRISDVFFIGFQEDLDDDFEILKEILGLPESVKLPESDVEAHRNPPDLDTNLENEAVANLKEWYAREYDFLNLCRDWREKFEANTGCDHAGPHGA